MPSSHRPMADVVPMMPASSSWPPSQALTLIVMSRLAASTRARLLRGKSCSSELAQRSRLRPAGRRSGSGSSAARRCRRRRRRPRRDDVPTASPPPAPGARSTASLQREVFLQQPFRDQELLRLLEHLVLAALPRAACACSTSGGMTSSRRPGRACRGSRDRGSRIASQRGKRVRPIGSSFCRSISRTIGLKPIASRPLM